MEQGSVLITGGSGLIGRYLSDHFIQKGFNVTHLSRNPSQTGAIKSFFWDPSKDIIDPDSLRNAKYIIHLAGANIGSGRWSNKRRQEIAGSRIKTADLILSTLNKNNFRPEAFISASATGYYGSLTSENIFTESDPPSDDFLGTVCRQWEEAAGRFSNEGIRTVVIRTGVVMDRNDGALSRLVAPARFGIFPIVGSGRQYMPWIHPADLTKVYFRAVTDPSMAGPYNAVAPDMVNHREFMRTLSVVMKKSFIQLPVPGAILKLMMGESATVALEGSRVSPLRLMSTGFSYSYPGLPEALEAALS